MSAAHDGPIAHLIAAEDQPRDAPGIEYQNSARRQQQMIDVYEAAHAIGDQHLVGGGRRNPLQACQQRLSARSSLVGTQPEKRQRRQQQDRRAEPNPLRFDGNAAHSSAALNAASVGGMSARCSGKRRRSERLLGTAIGLPMMGSTISLNFAGCAVATTTHG